MNKEEQTTQLFTMLKELGSIAMDTRLNLGDFDTDERFIQAGFKKLVPYLAELQTALDWNSLEFDIDQLYTLLYDMLKALHKIIGECMAYRITSRVGEDGITAEDYKGIADIQTHTEVCERAVSKLVCFIHGLQDKDGVMGIWK